MARQLDTTKMERSDNDDLEQWIRSTWKQNSYCEIYSITGHNWIKGRITKIYSDDDGEWLKVEYAAGKTKRTREVFRDDSHAIRPVLRALKIYEYTFNALRQKPKAAESACKFGQMQSPINIVTAKSGHSAQNKHIVVSDGEFHRNPLQFNYPSTVKNCTILNNGHTVQINIDAANKCMVSVHNKEYELKQFHFHTPSEHTVDNETYEMEMHLVHVNAESEIAVLGFIFTSKRDFKRARPKLQLSQSRAHLFLPKDAGKKESKASKLATANLKSAIQEEDEEEWKSMGDDSDFSTDESAFSDDEAAADGDKGTNIMHESTGNDFLDQFWKQLPIRKTETDIALENDISFDSLFEMASNNFIKTVKTNEMHIDMEIFEYEGSLTTPPYTEGVQWLVSRRAHFMNKPAIYTLSSCWGHQCNARPVQKYFGRTVSLRSKSSLLMT